MATWLRAADVVVLPYRAIQNSGSAVLALSADRPVVVPALGAMRELQVVAGSDWVRCFDGDFDDRELQASLEWAGRQRAEVAPIERLAWDGIARDTVAFYRRLRGGSPAQTREPIHAAASG